MDSVRPARKLTVLVFVLVSLTAVLAVGPAQAQTFTLLHTFTGGSDGASPAGLVQDARGNLYGTTLFGGTANLGTVFKLDATGTETVLHSFTGPPDGLDPLGVLILDAAGNLYGTTQSGGTAMQGTVFKLDAARTETVLHSFTGPPDGALTPRPP
jgi:uncharacterized repeat protein (TIGR03803 family)